MGTETRVPLLSELRPDGIVLVAIAGITYIDRMIYDLSWYHRSASRVSPTGLVFQAALNPVFDAKDPFPANVELAESLCASESQIVCLNLRAT